MDSASSLFANLAFVGSQDRAMFVKVWRDGRVAEGGGLLNRYTVKSRIGGSNPPLSASSIKPPQCRPTGCEYHANKSRSASCLDIQYVKCKIVEIHMGRKTSRSWQTGGFW